MGKSFDSAANQNTPGFHTFRCEYCFVTRRVTWRNRVNLYRRWSHERLLDLSRNDKGPHFNLSSLLFQTTSSPRRWTHHRLLGSMSNNGTRFQSPYLTTIPQARQLSEVWSSSDIWEKSISLAVEELPAWHDSETVPRRSSKGLEDELIRGTSRFSGSQRQYQKECVLIIDQRTGELTLERLNCK